MARLVGPNLARRRIRPWRPSSLRTEIDNQTTTSAQISVMTRAIQPITMDTLTALALPAVMEPVMLL